MPPMIDKEKCVKCMTCVQICGMDVFGPLDTKEPTVMYPEECWHCRACVMDCPVGAITMRYPLPMSMLFQEVPSEQEMGWKR